MSMDEVIHQPDRRRHHACADNYGQWRRQRRTSRLCASVTLALPTTDN